MESRTQQMEKYLLGLLEAGWPRHKVEEARRRIERYQLSSVATPATTKSYSTDSSSYSTDGLQYSTTSEVPVVTESTSIVEQIGEILDEMSTEIGESVAEVGTVIQEIISENVTAIVQAVENVTLSVNEIGSTISGVLSQAEDHTNDTVSLLETVSSTVVTTEAITTQISGVETHLSESCAGSDHQVGFFELLERWVEAWSHNWSNEAKANGSQLLPAAGLEESITDRQADHEWGPELGISDTVPGDQLHHLLGDTPPYLLFTLLGITCSGKKKLKSFRYTEVYHL